MSCECSHCALELARTVERAGRRVAAFQRAKARDLYDLRRFATTLFEGELPRFARRAQRSRGRLVAQALSGKLDRMGDGFLASIARDPPPLIGERRGHHRLCAEPPIHGPANQ